MENIRECFKSHMLDFGKCFNHNRRRGNCCIPYDLFKRILDEYMESDYQKEEEFVLREYIPLGELYDRNKALAYAEAKNASIEDIITRLHTHQSREATIPCFFFFSPAKNCATYSTSGKEKR